MNDIHDNPELMRESALAVMRALGREPDPWQLEAMVSSHKQLLLNCCRQAGKSTTVAVLSLLEAVGNPGTKVLLLSRSFRQSRELFRQVAEYHQRLGSKFLLSKTAHELCLENYSRIVCLPCREEKARKGAEREQRELPAGNSRCPLFRCLTKAPSNGRSDSPMSGCATACSPWGDRKTVWTYQGEQAVAHAAWTAQGRRIKRQAGPRSHPARRHPFIRIAPGGTISP